MEAAVEDQEVDMAEAAVVVVVVTEEAVETVKEALAAFLVMVVMTGLGKQVSFSRY